MRGEVPGAMQKWGTFADHALERDFRQSIMRQEVRALRMNLLALMFFYLMPLALDFVYLPRETIFNLFLPLRLGVYVTILLVMLIPARNATYGLRHAATLFLLSYIWVMTAMVALWVERQDVGFTVSFFVMIVVLMNYLFLPTRWLWMVGWGVAASALYLWLVMPYSGATTSQIKTAMVMQTLANIFGAVTAYQLATLRRSEFHRRREQEAERRRLEEANVELLHRETIIALQRDQLASKVEELEEAQRQLIETKDSLVQAEKMASLGGLVAGVAHELNTPMGIAVTASTHLRDCVDGLDQAVAGNRLTRSQLADYQQTLRETAALILANVARAAGLVQSFKQVAVDQASAECRPFELGAYIEEILLSLAPRLRQEPHQISVGCPPGLMMDSYPGALSQILTNLLINALIHAFPDGRAGNISIQARLVSDDLVEMVFADDGKGVLPEHQDRLFDPFFTTNRAHGGSGLGLHIVYNLVTQSLRGTIRLQSEPGQGARFILTIPRRVGEPARLAG
ncbi:ATP-binding protein [Niveispirillum sp. SYP-B3756]|uniref:sensor histidine kinase n=1 Tax=Niveispirillum sp. SYP-B3756 TaxID=2662178 RepID=UPI001567B861|nr:ATP-binding protein [Niveispirillum sp. SYP-B3756]